MAEISPVRLVDDMLEAFVSTAAISREVSRRLMAGRLRKLASRLYTANFADAPEAIVRRNLWDIVAGYFPGALIADRTALENAPAADGLVCLVARRGGDIALRLRRGTGPVASDRPFLGDLFLSSTARAYLDNLRPSRARSGLLPRTVSRHELEEQLDNLIRRAGLEAVRRLRDEALSLAAVLDRTAEARKLDALIGALAGTRKAKPTSSAARARRRGKSYDRPRLALFEILHRALRREPPGIRLAAERDAEQTATLAFYDAYFSNFIEGTEFAVDAAADIVFRSCSRIPRPMPTTSSAFGG